MARGRTRQASQVASAPARARPRAGSGAAGGGAAFRGKRESGRESPYSCLVLAGARSMDERREALQARSQRRRVVAGAEAGCGTLGNGARLLVVSLAAHLSVPPAPRLSALQAFKDGDVRFLICTDVAARGLDIQARRVLARVAGCAAAGCRPARMSTDCPAACLTRFFTPPCYPHPASLQTTPPPPNCLAPPNPASNSPASPPCLPQPCLPSLPGPALRHQHDAARPQRGLHPPVRGRHLRCAVQQLCCAAAGNRRAAALLPACSSCAGGGAPCSPVPPPTRAWLPPFLLSPCAACTLPPAPPRSVGRVGRADALGLAISLVATVPEKARCRGGRVQGGLPL